MDTIKDTYFCCGSMMCFNCSRVCYICNKWTCYKCIGIHSKKCDICILGIENILKNFGFIEGFILNHTVEYDYINENWLIYKDNNPFNLLFINKSLIFLLCEFKPIFIIRIQNFFRKIYRSPVPDRSILGPARPERPERLRH